MTYVISDVHGEYHLFIKLLEKINFSNSDTLIICGDVVDKGLDSVKLLQYVLSKSNIKMIIGNHEYDFLKKYWALTLAMREQDLPFQILQASLPVLAAALREGLKRLPKE